MTEIMVAIVLGITLGWTDVLSYTTKERLNKLSMFCLLVMLFCLGAKIGCDQELLNNLGVLGKQSLFMAMAVITGSICMVFLVYKIFQAEVDDAVENGGEHHG